MRTLIALKNGTEIPINQSNMDGEFTDAKSVYRAECQVDVVETERQTFATPFTHNGTQYDVWVIDNLPVNGSTAPTPPEVTALLARYPQNPPVATGYVVRRVYGIDPSAGRIELGGAAPTPGYYMLLSGAKMGVEARVLAHELGHNLGLPNVVGVSRNLMIEATPIGDDLTDAQCSTVISSDITR